jgi:hypothetical protein
VMGDEGESPSSDTFYEESPNSTLNYAFGGQWNSSPKVTKRQEEHERRDKRRKKESTWKFLFNLRREERTYFPKWTNIRSRVVH